ncbi:hypothetical protein LIP_2021 [Limnochorda pilosa]|uniref:Uncharacterized protein n=1 Tax=Limnochorda pilosa TaxID=1555112 RepID=A0A0K2SLH8_LIMPI|nr:hypothetical protein LIP_2021 [Limnochorda pilosa]
MVLTPDPADRHTFHVAVTGWLEQASQIATFQTGLTEDSPDPLGYPPQVLYMETFTTTQFQPELYVNVSAWYPTARQALLQHRTSTVRVSMRDQEAVSQMYARLPEKAAPWTFWSGTPHQPGVAREGPVDLIRVEAIDVNLSATTATRGRPSSTWMG